MYNHAMKKTRLLTLALCVSGTLFGQAKRLYIDPVQQRIEDAVTLSTPTPPEIVASAMNVFLKSCPAVTMSGSSRNADYVLVFTGGFGSTLYLDGNPVHVFSTWPFTGGRAAKQVCQFITSGKR